MKLYKIGCRWDKEGKPGKSVLDVFIKNQKVFIGTENCEDPFAVLQIGDRFIVGDGFAIVAIGIITGKSCRLCDADIEVDSITRERSFDPDDEEPGVCCPCRIVKLQGDDCFEFKLIGRFRGVNNIKIKEDVAGLFEKYKL